MVHTYMSKNDNQGNEQTLENFRLLIDHWNSLPAKILRTIRLRNLT